MENNKGRYWQINKSLNICAFDEYLQGQTARLPHIESDEQLTPRVLRVLGQNPGKVNASSSYPTPSYHIIWGLMFLHSLRIKELIHTSSAPANTDSSLTPVVASQHGPN